MFKKEWAEESYSEMFTPPWSKVGFKQRDREGG